MCVILFANINGQKILAKNRDRAYKPSIEIIHEIVNGLEVAYIRDKEKGWIEGMNEYGNAMVNSTLSSNKLDSQKRNVKKNKMYSALIEKDEKSFFHKLLKNDTSDLLLEGHTLIINNNNVYHLENNIHNSYNLENVTENSAFTNHGINLKNEGYQSGKKGLSSFLRKKIVEKEMKELNSIKTCDEKIIYDKISSVLNKDYKNIDPRFHPYRDKKTTVKRIPKLSLDQIFINTSGQLLLNTTNKDFVYYRDINNSEKVEYVNKLPKGYNPQIRVIIKETQKEIEKDSEPTKIFTKEYLKKLYKRFDIKESLYNYKKRKTTKNRSHKKKLISLKSNQKKSINTHNKTKKHLS
jgi:hypothetical protein